jgi:hypothetical protein
MMLMEAIFTALDTLCGILVTASFAMIAFTHMEMKAARVALILNPV